MVLGLPRVYSARDVLPISFREGDQHAQSGEQPLGGFRHGLKALVAFLAATSIGCLKRQF
jgi:hypothetical protein